jgi:hypothetical protein
MEEAKRRIQEAKRRIEALKKGEERKASEEEFKRREIKSPEKPVETLKKEEMVKQELGQEPILEKPSEEKGGWDRLRKEWEELEKEREKPWQRKGMEERKGEAKKPSLVQAPTQIIRPLPEKPSLKERVGIRIVILLLLLVFLAAIGTFWWWFFKIKKPPQLPPPFSGQGTTTSETGTIPPETEVEISVPPSLISVKETFTLEISDPTELSNSLSPIMKKGLPEDQFSRIVVKNLKHNKVLSLKEFFEVFQVGTPESLLEKLKDDFTLFVFSSKTGSRLGFIAEIKNNEGLADLLISWEKTMEKDTEALSQFSGKTSQAPVPDFKSGKYQGVPFRYLDFPMPDFGICYAIDKNFFVFTFSGQSLLEIIDEVAK